MYANKTELLNKLFLNIYSNSDSAFGPSNCVIIIFVQGRTEHILFVLIYSETEIMQKPY